MTPSNDRLSIRDFTRELAYGVSAKAVASMQNPLALAVEQIEANPEHLQSLLLARVLNALTFGAGQFRKSEVFGFDKAARTLAVALNDVRACGGLSNNMWENAVNAAGAAQGRALGSSSTAPKRESQDVDS